jgi:hypothetical protein
MNRRTIFAGLAAAIPGVVTGASASAHDDAGCQDHPGGGMPPLPTVEADWASVASALGRAGGLSAGTVYRVGFPRRDLTVVSYGVTVKAGLSLGSYAAFARYPDGQAMMMGDLVVTEPELPVVTDALHANGIDQTAIHKHLLTHEPGVWWTHMHAIGDPQAIATGIKAVLDHTSTPPAVPPSPPQPLELDSAGIDAALGTAGRNDGGIYKFTFARTATVAVHGRQAPPAMGVTTAIGFQPLGGGRAAVNGDVAMTAHEVQPVIMALRVGGINIVELHNHSLDDRPRLFYLHFWATDDAVHLARGLAAAVHATAVQPE